MVGVYGEGASSLHTYIHYYTTLVVWSLYTEMDQVLQCMCQLLLTCDTAFITSEQLRFDDALSVPCSSAIQHASMPKPIFIILR